MRAKPHLTKHGAHWYCGVRNPRRAFYICWQGDTLLQAWAYWSYRQHYPYKDRPR